MHTLGNYTKAEINREFIIKYFPKRDSNHYRFIRINKVIELIGEEQALSQVQRAFNPPPRKFKYNDAFQFITRCKKKFIYELR